MEAAERRVTMAQSSIPIKGIYDPDLERVLRQLAIYDELLSGKMRCAVCRNEVTLENLGAVFPRENQICATCDSPHCIHTVTAVRQAK